MISSWKRRLKPVQWSRARQPALGDDVADSLDWLVVFTRGHSLASTGTSIQRAVLRAISVDIIAVAVAVRRVGGRHAELIGGEGWVDSPKLAEPG
ncbi:hypothetical protein AB4Z09_24240 [Rhodococcus sp. TAF43]|uniref:hypothetical protein n=1 Tax=Rhodococcus sp. TAF43 TaxID=3237483 RepID=UPI003F965EBA